MYIQKKKKTHNTYTLHTDKTNIYDDTLMWHAYMHSCICIHTHTHTHTRTHTHTHSRES